MARRRYGASAAGCRSWQSTTSTQPHSLTATTRTTSRRQDCTRMSLPNHVCVHVSTNTQTDGQHENTMPHNAPHTHTSVQRPFSVTTQVSRNQKGRTNLDFTGARDSEWQWHQLGHMQVCTSLQTDNHASNPPLSFLQARCPSCRPTNSVKALNPRLHIQEE